jgi:hypothetical protein
MFLVVGLPLVRLVLDISVFVGLVMLFVSRRSQGLALRFPFLDSRQFGYVVSIDVVCLAVF